MKTRTTPAIAFDDVGDGDPALLLMPGWCAPRTAFRSLLAPAAAQRRVLALDWRGHGGSGPSAGDFGAEDLLGDALAVVQAAGVARFVPVGLAHAGWIAIELRRRLGPERVPAIVLIDWMLLGPPPPFLDALAALQDPGSWSGVRAKLFSMWTEGVASPEVHEVVARMGAHGREMWARGAREIAASFRAHGSPVKALDGLAPPCPVLHVYAQPAGEAALRAQQEHAASRPWLHVCRVAAASHFPMLEAPVEVAAAIESFLSGVAVG